MAIRQERILASPRWDGQGFRNTRVIQRGDPAVPMPKISEFLFGGERRVPNGPLPVLNPLASWARWSQSGLRATWLGHSTVLLEIDGYRVLTDPVWGPRASPSRFIGPKRSHPMPVSIDELPPLDAVIVSHDHYDHLDYSTMRQMRRMRVPIITSLGVGAHLERFGIAAERIVELDWWESHRVRNTGLTLTAAPSQHFSGRGLTDRNHTAWSSFAIESERHKVFFSGDTGLTEEYTEIRERLGPFDLVMMEVGAFHPAWSNIHLGPQNALAAHALLGGGPLLPIHWATFSLALHPWDEPAETLLKLAPDDGAQLWMPRLGEAFEPSHEHRIQPWWRNVDVRAGRTPIVQAPRLSQPMSWPVD